ncbi:hybrid sensor histidine kinase/response regulator [Natronospirillum operosum]|nr:hybrid sensor histidine kinase/response regulator [Natronospirillum operosum]
MQWERLPDNSIQKKRSLLRTIDREISRQGRISVFGHLLVFLYVEWLMGFDALSPVQSYGIGLLLLLVAIWRLVYLLQFDHFYGRGPKRWRNQYGMVTLAGAALWSCYLTLTIVLPSYDASLTFIWVYTAAVCATHIYIFAPYPRMAEWYNRILLIPPAIAGILMFELEYSTLGLGVLLFYVFMNRVGRRISRQHWESLENRERLEYELGKASASEQQAALRADDSERFMANLTAMIKTPLNGVLGMLSLLTTARLRKEDRKLVEVASQSAHSLAELVDDFDTYLRVRGHFLNEEKKVFNVARHLESVMENLGPVAHEREVELSYTMRPDLPERVNGSPRQITTLFKQLTTFAVSLSTGPEVSMKVQDAIEGEGIDVSVRFQADIDEQTLEDMQTLLRTERGFEALGHVDVTLLSLVIIASLVRQHDGRIRLNVLTTEGHRIYQVSIRLPLEASTQGGRVFSASRHFAGKSVLMTGFPEYGAQAVGAELESWGMSVTRQELDEQAIPGPETAPEQDYWIINVPVRLTSDALGVLEKIAAYCRDHDTLRPLLMVTAAQQTLLADWFEEDQLLNKPVPRRTLHRWLLRKPIDRQDDDDVNEITERLAGRRVLVVEENAVNAMVARKILQRLGIETVVVGSARAARERFRADSFDMVWVDQELADMSGHEAVALLRNDEREEGAEPAVILGITTTRSPAVERNCMAAGMDDILEKPLNLNQVAETLQRHLV